MFIRQNVVFWNALLLLSWMSVIFFFSSLAGSPDSFDPPFWYVLERKGAHVFEYMVLLFLFVRFMVSLLPREPFWKTLSISLASTFLFAVSDELHQFFVPYRGAKITDVGIDGIGMVCMAGILFLLWHRSKEKK